MARLRKFAAYRSIERPYTRRSKYRNKSFIKANPSSKIVRFDGGNLKRDFDYEIDLVSKSTLQIRHNAIESARLTSMRTLEKSIGKAAFHLKIRVYPHHILRENPLASGAGADRMSTGMKMSFGKPIGSAAQIKSGQEIFTAFVDKQNIEIAKKAIKKASYKLPGNYSVVIKEAKKPTA